MKISKGENMCFSASASIIAGTVLSVIGIASISQIKQKAYYPFACIPLLFALQQFAEGIIWLSTTSYAFSTMIVSWASLIFLFFAYVVWPLWIPFSLYLIEKNELIKKILVGCEGVGLIISGYLLFILFKYGVTIIIDQHILYELSAKHFIAQKIGLILYGIATVLPFFISTFPIINFFGILLLVSLIVTLLFWSLYFTSVWCFFAALLSGCVLYISMKIKNR